MVAVWSMTSLGSGRFNPVEKSSDMSDLRRDFSELRSRGEGYLEVRILDSEFPRLALSFCGDQAVVHLFAYEASVSLLVGDGATSPEATVDVPVMDESTTFTGDFVLGVDHAWEVVQKFAQAQAFEELGEWRELQ